MVQRVFRFAPSPNGHLHLGHAYSALLNARMAKECGGRFLVRIEDIDTVRCSRALAHDALEDLAWLGVRWEEPVRYQSEHMLDFQNAQQELTMRGLLYPCFCSRREVAARCQSGPLDPEGQPIYDGFCRSIPQSHQERMLAQGVPHAMRLQMTAAMERLGKNIDARSWGDIILVRRDIGTSYHVAVVVDDALQRVTDVVRGQDLESVTSIHLLLQRLLGLPSPAYLHHRLITDDAGQKLGKSVGSRSLRSLRQDGMKPDQVRHVLGFG